MSGDPLLAQAAAPPREERDRLKREQAAQRSRSEPDRSCFLHTRGIMRPIEASICVIRTATSSWTAGFMNPLDHTRNQTQLVFCRENVDPDFVTRLLGLNPSEALKVGDPAKI
jgi:hypothetical protein